jgi:hypothetical protein
MLLLAGCQAENPAAPADPFLFGPTRVAPPATGAVGPQAGVGSNRAVPAGLVSTPVSNPNTSAVVATPAPAFGSSVQAPASGVVVTPAGDQIKIPDAARKLDAPGTLAAGVTPSSSTAVSGFASPALPPSPAMADRRSDPLPSGQDRVVQTLLPRSQAPSSPSQFAPPGSARPLQAPATSGGSKSNVVDIDDLPPSTPPLGQPQTSYRPSTIQLVSGTEEIEASPQDHSRDDRLKPGLPTDGRLKQAASQYGYDPQYGWLRGKLEYSESERHWKLRYIPIDGATDGFGGSVILADTPLLSGYERGDFVEVAGKLASTSPDKRGYAPKYQVSQLKRLAN